MNIVERVRQMERHLDDVLDAFYIRKVSLKDCPEIQEKITLLENYYDSGEWLKDYDRDARGELPEGMKRGVLAQDTLYNLFSDIREQFTQEPSSES